MVRSSSSPETPPSLTRRISSTPFLRVGENSIRPICAALIIAALAPTLLTSIPAMVDYPNHLARMAILSRIGTSQANQFYEAHWAFYPNLAMDIVVPLLAKLIGPIAATHIFFFSAQFLILTGAIFLERVVKGHIGLSPFAAALFLYSTPFAFGFLNFEFGAGLALWALAFMIRLENAPYRARLLAHSIACALLFVTHLFAFGVYGAALGFLELERILRRNSRIFETAGRAGLLAAPAFVLFVAMSVGGGTVGSKGTMWGLAAKPYAALHILSGYSFTLSAACVAILIVVVLRLTDLGYLKIDRRGAAIALGFSALFVVMPSKLFGTSYVDMRLIPAAALILPAFSTIKFPTFRHGLAIAGIFAGAALANIILVGYVWTSYSPEYRALIASFSKLGDHAPVLVGHSGAGDDPPKDLTEYPIYNAPTLAAGFAGAFVPNLFTDKGKQPLEARPDMRALDIGYGAPAPVALLKAIADGKATSGAPGYLRDWPRDFDYLYVVGPPKPNPMPDRLEELSAGSRFILYRIIKRNTSQATCSPA